MTERVINCEHPRERAPEPPQIGTDAWHTEEAKKKPWGSQRLQLLKGEHLDDERSYKTFEEYRAGWEKYRDEIMKSWMYDLPCTRPAAWWLCEFPSLDELPTEGELHRSLFGRKFPDLRDQPTYLELHGCLTDQERAKLDAQSK